MTLPLKNGLNADQTIQTLDDLAKGAGGVGPTVLRFQPTDEAMNNDIAAGDWKPVAANASSSVLGNMGAAGDFLSHILVVPTTKNPGPISIKDGAGGTSVVVFAGGTDSVLSLTPFVIVLQVKCVNAGWRLSVGQDASAVAVGNFT